MNNHTDLITWSETISVILLEGFGVQCFQLLTLKLLKYNFKTKTKTKMHLKAARQTDVPQKNGTLKRFDGSKSPAGVIQKHTKDSDTKSDQEAASMLFMSQNHFRNSLQAHPKNEINNAHRSFAIM